MTVRIKQQLMFNVLKKEGNLVAYGKTKKDKTLINMALAITTRGKVLENPTSKDIEIEPCL